MSLAINGALAPANMPVIAARYSFRDRTPLPLPFSVAAHSTVWVQLGAVAGTTRSLSFVIDGISMATQTRIDQNVTLALAVLLRYPGDSVSLTQLIDSPWKPHPAFTIDGNTLSKASGNTWDAVPTAADLLSPGVHIYNLRIDCIRFNETYVGLVPSHLDPFTSNGWLRGWFVQLSDTTIRLRNDSLIREVGAASLFVGPCASDFLRVCVSVVCASK
eukprot:TRINITY_DN9067_c0_g2_i2.p1 TRINITY_DN9067_c0_g2~~TRINITY_DN9067_c0_g2_i2.p1  ORF type:complete len:217 (-),score=11.64 TRINITY_DN9067_c0_g2_i2:374-1024(-)